MGGAYATEMLTYDHRQARKLRHYGVTPLWCRHTTTGMHGSCTTVELHHYGADIRPWKLCHCGVTPLRCKHMTTGMHGSCTTVELHRYGADIRPQACMEAAPLRRYTAMVQTYDHKHAWKLHR